MKNWKQLSEIFEFVPETHRHFYEIIDNRCKFFLKLCAKCSDISWSDWNESINFIKKELIILFDKVFHKNIDILEYGKIPSFKEPFFHAT